jgi:hypothetical protein
VQGFDFSVDFRVGNGTSTPADGFSVNYARDGDPVFDNPINGWTTGPNAEANLPEEGSTTGLGIGFDTCQSGTTAPSGQDGNPQWDTIGISVRVENVLVF